MDVTGSIQGHVSEGEWRARVDLAALYRLVALEGWDDMIFTHISARVPGAEHHFLINPYGQFFGEITASALVKIDLDGNIIQQTSYPVNRAGFTIHSAIHAARDDARFIMHLHTDHGIAVASQAEGVLPLSQHALLVRNQLAYHDYEGIALDLDERERLVSDLGDKKLLMLRNHGTLAVGETAGECWVGMFYLERACRQQVLALSAGRERLLEAPKPAQEKVREQSRGNFATSGERAWPACLRELDRVSSGYDT